MLYLGTNNNSLKTSLLEPREEFHEQGTTESVESSGSQEPKASEKRAKTIEKASGLLSASVATGVKIYELFAVTIAGGAPDIVGGEFVTMA